MKPTLYLETSIPSYLTARESRDIVVAAHQQITREWWEVGVRHYRVFISEAVLRELMRGDPDAAKRRLAVVENIDVIEPSADVEALAAAYMQDLEIPKAAAMDALHLAFASIAGLDYLVTWNCRHLARPSVKKRLPAINAAFGYNFPVVCTPEELLYENHSMDGPDCG